MDARKGDNSLNFFNAHHLHVYYRDTPPRVFHLLRRDTTAGVASQEPRVTEAIRCLHKIVCRVITFTIIITNSQTSRAARSLNSVVTSRGVPAYCILLSIPRDHGTSTQVFRWRLCHEGLCVCLSWISLVE